MHVSPTPKPATTTSDLRSAGGGGGILIWYGKPYREPVESGWNTRVMEHAGRQVGRLSGLSGNISAVLVANLHQKEAVRCSLGLVLVHQVV